MNKFFLKALFLVITTGVFAQETNPEESKVKIDVSGYLEAFYGYDFNQP